MVSIYISLHMDPLCLVLGGLEGAWYEDNGRVGRLIFSLSLSVHLQTENDKYKYKYRGKDKERGGMGLSGPGMRIMVGCDD